LTITLIKPPANSLHDVISVSRKKLIAADFDFVVILINQDPDDRDIEKQVSSFMASQ
jgi:hypothetical protein